MIKLDLQRFAEEQGGAAAPGGDVTGGMQAGQTAEQTNAQLTPFQQMIQGEGKAEFEQAIKNAKTQAVMDRFKERQREQEEIRHVRGIMEFLGKKHNVDPKDYRAIEEKVTDDLEQYREEADKLGYTPEAVRNMHKMARAVETAKEEAKMATEELAKRDHFLKLSQQAEELKKTFPSFDLLEEIKEPRFRRMTDMGISVKDAFYAIHNEEIQRQIMQYTAQQAGQRIAASVQAGASRPQENGMRQQNPVNMVVDIQHMDKKQREEYRRRIHNGESIDFRNKF